METYQTYNGYGIRYSTLGGTTKVEFNGFIIKKFVGFGEFEGLKLAKNFIDTY